MENNPDVTVDRVPLPADDIRVALDHDNNAVENMAVLGEPDHNVGIIEQGSAEAYAAFGMLHRSYILEDILDLIKEREDLRNCAPSNPLINQILNKRIHHVFDQDNWHLHFTENEQLIHKRVYIKSMEDVDSATKFYTPPLADCTALSVLKLDLYHHDKRTDNELFFGILQFLQHSGSHVKYVTFNFGSTVNCEQVYDRMALILNNLPNVMAIFLEYNEPNWRDDYLPEHFDQTRMPHLPRLKYVRFSSMFNRFVVSNLLQRNKQVKTIFIPVSAFATFETLPEIIRAALGELDLDYYCGPAFQNQTTIEQLGWRDTFLEFNVDDPVY